MQSTERLAKMILNTNYNDFPKKTIKHAKDLGVSYLGSILWGSTLPVSKILNSLIKEWGGPPEAVVVGESFRTTAVNAAFSNANSVHAAEFEAVSWPECCGHMGIYPAVLAVGEKYCLSGKQILEAVIIGHEVQSRVSMACLNAHNIGFFPIPLFGPMGVAAGTGKLLGLDVNQMRRALGIAASQAAGIRRQAGTMTHYIDQGFSVRNGITAALLAQCGFTSDLNIFETVDGIPGFCEAHNGGEEYNLDKQLDDWGNPFRIELNGTKTYPCCNHLQRFVDAALDVVIDHNISEEEVAIITAEGNETARRLLDNPDPHDAETTRFSVHHGVAAALIERDVNKIRFTSFTDDKAVDSKYKEIRKKVKFINHPEWEHGLAGVNIVTITLKNNKKYSSERAKLKAEFSTDYCVAKCRDSARDTLPQEQLDLAISLSLDMENLKNVKELMDILI